MQLHRTPHSNRGFTLIEMLVVMVLIGLLAGLVGPKLFGRVDSSKVQTAAAQIKMLKGSIETFHLDVGRFPTQAEGLTALNQSPTEDRARARWRGPYLDQDLPDDPWGTPYVYSVPGANGRPFALYSFGADGKRGGEGTDADIGILPASQ
jgi:general secretion pathway protein G